MKHQKPIDLQLNIKKFGEFRPEYPLTAHDVAYKTEEGKLYETEFRDYPRQQFRKYLGSWRKIKFYGSLKFGFEPYPEGYTHYQICWNQKPVKVKYKGDWRNGMQEEEYFTFPIWNYGKDAAVISITTTPEREKIAAQFGRKHTIIYFDSIDDDIGINATLYSEDQDKKARSLRNFITKNKNNIKFLDLLEQKLRLNQF